MKRRKKRSPVIHVIRVDAQGRVDTDPCEVYVNDEIHWIGTTTDVKLEIKFNDTTPVGWKKRPRFPDRGKVAKGKVGRERKGEHSYKATGSRKRSGKRKKSFRADPIIIVRDT